MEFDRVELPFIIALWIFVSSLAKIGKNDNDFIQNHLLINPYQNFFKKGLKFVEATYG